MEIFYGTAEEFVKEVRKWEIPLSDCINVDILPHVNSYEVYDMCDDEVVYYILRPKENLFICLGEITTCDYWYDDFENLMNHIENNEFDDATMNVAEMLYDIVDYYIRSNMYNNDIYKIWNNLKKILSNKNQDRKISEKLSEKTKLKGGVKMFEKLKVANFKYSDAINFKTIGMTLDGEIAIPSDDRNMYIYRKDGIFEQAMFYFEVNLPFSKIVRKPNNGDIICVDGRFGIWENEKIVFPDGTVIQVKEPKTLFGSRYEVLIFNFKDKKVNNILPFLLITKNTEEILPFILMQQSSDNGNNLIPYLLLTQNNNKIRNSLLLMILFSNTNSDFSEYLPFLLINDEKSDNIVQLMMLYNMMNKNKNGNDKDSKE